MKRKPSHQYLTTKSDIAITISVGSGQVRAEARKICLNAGMTQTMMTQMTRMATTITEIG